MSDPKKPSPEAAPTPTPGTAQPKGRIVRDVFAVALNDVMDALAPLSDADRRLMMQVLNARIPAADTSEPRM